MAPAASNELPFTEDALVMIVGMPDKGGQNSNGATGKLVKCMGSSRWAVRLDGEERTKPFHVQNLQVLPPLDDVKADEKPSRHYSILGSWDDWEAHEMAWSSKRGCFVYEVCLNDKTESFKILEEGDWDRCIYPTMRDANPYVRHGILGPDSANVDEEWVIGVHPSDRAAPGKRYEIHFFLDSRRRPKEVKWEMKPEQVQKPRKGDRQSLPWNAPLEAKGQAELGSPQAAGGVSLEAPPLQPTEWELQQLKFEEHKVREAEKAARERLMKHVDTATDQLVAVEGANSHLSPESEQEWRILENKRRYIHDLSLAAQGLNEVAPDGILQNQTQGSCVECGVQTRAMNGGCFCCDACKEAYDSICREGWNGSVELDGIFAAARAKTLAKDRDLSANEARREVMRRFGKKFTVPKGAAA